MGRTAVKVMYNYLQFEATLKNLRRVAASGVVIEVVLAAKEFRTKSYDVAPSSSERVTERLQGGGITMIVAMNGMFASMPGSQASVEIVSVDYKEPQPVLYTGQSMLYVAVGVVAIVALTLMLVMIGRKRRSRSLPSTGKTESKVVQAAKSRGLMHPFL